ncbi:MAG: hypothetical protein V5A88_07200 [Candidatus Thermoplasmatota archaeon]
MVITPEENQTIEAGDMLDFEAELYDAYDNLIEEEDNEFMWKNTDDTGIFSETEAGDYGVTAAYEGITSPPVLVTVEPSDVVEVIIHPDKDQTVTTGESLLFQAEAYDTYDNLITEDPEDFEWKNAPEGSFAEEQEGRYNVTARYDEMESSSVSVVVEEDTEEETVFEYGVPNDYWWLILILIAIASIIISQIGLMVSSRKERS